MCQNKPYDLLYEQKKKMKFEAVFEKENEIKEFYDCFVWKLRPRSRGRSKVEVENVIFADFILNCIDHSQLRYPVSITYDDRPDFVISNNNQCIGIEITEQWSKNFGHALCLSEKQGAFIEPSDFNIDTDTKKQKGKQIAALVSKSKLIGPPSIGYQEEENWVKRTLQTANIKAQKFAKYPDQKNYTENYLVIFDVRPESPDFDDINEKMLSPIYSLAETTPFTKIFCLDSHIIEIDLIKKKFVITRIKTK